MRSASQIIPSSQFSALVQCKCSLTLLAVPPAKAVTISGAAFEAAKEGIPAIATSGTGTQHEAWTDLTTAPDSTSILNAVTNAALTNKLVAALFAQASADPPSTLR